MRISHWSKVDTRWYLGVRCLKCEEPILFALDHSEGGAQPTPPGKLSLTCAVAECRHHADYSTAPVLRFQKPPRSPKEAEGRVMVSQGAGAKTSDL